MADLNTVISFAVPLFTELVSVTKLTLFDFRLLGAWVDGLITVGVLNRKMVENPCFSWVIWKRVIAVTDSKATGGSDGHDFYFIIEFLVLVFL